MAKSDLIIGAHLSGGLDVITPYNQALELGASCFQMFIGNTHTFFPYPVTDERSSHALQMRIATGLKVAVHGCYVVNICYDGPERSKYKLGIKSIMEQWKAAERVGADYLVMHIGSHKGAGMDQGMAWLTEATQFILDHMKGTRCKLLYENTAGGGTQVGHVENLYQVMETINQPDRLGMCIDTTHSYADGHRLDDPGYCDEFWAKYLKHCNWVHFNNPDPKVELLSHLDRHSLPWNKAKWPEEVMIRMAGKLAGKVPLLMEADQDAYSINMMLLEEAGLL
jgi:deoxyribonuclease-4